MLSSDLLIPKKPLPHLTPAQEKILEYLLDRPDKVAYMSSAELALSLDISNATVIRFCQHIGFKGYLDLQRHIRELIKARLTLPQRLQKQSSNIRETGDILRTVLKSDQANLTNAMKNVSPALFEQVVNEVHQRRELWVLGLRSFFGPAHSFATTLGVLARKANLITLDAGTVWDYIQPGLHEDTLLISISFPRYCRLTLDITRQFFDSGAKVVALTDSHASPLARTSSMVIPLPCWIDSFFESQVAVTSFFNAVLAGVSFLDGAKTMSRLQHLEEIWTEKQVFLDPGAGFSPSWADQFTDNPES